MVVSRVLILPADPNYADGVLIKCHSHRARRNVAALLGFSTRWGDGLQPFPAYYSWKVPGNWHYVPPDRLDDVLAIKGVTRTHRPPVDLRPCWGGGQLL